MNLGERLKLLRLQKEISQTELAKRFNIARSTLSQYESNTRTPSDEMKLKFAEYYNVSLDYLLGKSDSSEPNTAINLTEKDKKDIQKDLKNIMDDFKEQTDGTKYYNGIELRDEDFDLIETAMNVALEQIKIKNKKKYTPDKFKK
ncbi:helix-turn-helix domain-containing protein [Clostridium beijerinckii]|uniref:Transcriptional regulator with XRE-family HTH domain n=1 Tax=Clostridium beijerinckii TaxID=1520 RepID=A0AAX0B684_CLOBE|nr:transcriptional regulator with XRE-family HTH domain [Clostridium beijerinckii]NYC70428.1 transcriptional regulator with XRE-family HTH domain [Clostridium beijerinckii]